MASVQLAIGGVPNRLLLQAIVLSPRDAGKDGLRRRTSPSGDFFTLESSGRTWRSLVSLTAFAFVKIIEVKRKLQAMSWITRNMIDKLFGVRSEYSQLQARTKRFQSHLGQYTFSKFCFT